MDEAANGKPQTGGSAIAARPETQLRRLLRKAKRKHFSPRYGWPRINWKKMSAVSAVFAILAFSAGVYHRQRTLPDDATLSQTFVTAPQPSTGRQSDMRAINALSHPSEEQQPPPKSAAVTAPSEAEPLSLARSGRIPEAADLWFRMLSAQPQVGWTVQVEVACRQETVQNGLTAFEDGSRILVVPIVYRGRPCYRVLYGIYDSQSAATQAVRSLPVLFLKQESPPKAVPILKIVQ